MQTIPQTSPPVNRRTRKPEEQLAAKLGAARQRSAPWAFVGELEMYCQNSRCPARTVTLFVKEHDSKTPDTLTCPACQRPLKVHHVETIGEVHRNAELDARQSVLVQMYDRDHATPDGFSLTPAHVFFDDRLPPTPPGWWEHRQ